MEKNTQYHLNRRPTNRLVPATEHREANALSGVDQETTAWEIYNDRALTIDRELMKDWNDSLYTLLIFAALYSAILTAFIIESMNLIQEDPTETTRDILLIITRQLANNSVAAFNPEPFVAPAWAIRVNYYFFTAISCTLMSALSAVLALQWVGSYDTGLNPSSPEGRALQRHVRHQGVETWRMVQIIAFLPVLIFIALFLFFVGLAEWMWTIHQGVSVIIIAGVILGAAFVLMTTAISMTFVGAPFRTPTSRSLPGLAAGIYYSIYRIISGLTLQGVVSTFQHFGIYVTSALSSMAVYWKRQQSGSSKLRSIRRFLKSPHLLMPFEELEKEMVHSVADIKATSLIWLAKSIDVLPHNFAHFQSILREILTLPSEELVNLSKHPAPWSSIFTLLLDPHQIPPSDIVLGDDESSDLDSMGEGAESQDAALSDHPFSDREVALQASMLLGKQSVNLVDIMETRYQYASNQQKVIATLRWSVQRWEHDKSNLVSVVEMMSAAINGVGVLPTNFIAAHLLNVYKSKSQLGNLDLNRYYVYRRPTKYHRISRPLDKSIVLDHMSERPPPPFPDQIIDILLDIMAHRFAQALPSGNTALERYINAAELFLQQGNGDFDIHNAIITQILGGILRQLEGEGEKPDVAWVLSTIIRLLRAYLTPRSNAAVTAGVLRVLRHLYFLQWESDSTIKHLITSIYALVLPSAYSFEGEDWTECRVRFYTGLDKLSQTGDWSSAIKQALIWAQVRDERVYGQQIPTLSKSQMGRLLDIQNPILWLHASILAGSKWMYPSRVPKILLTRNESARNCREVWDVRKLEQSHWSYSELSFTRNLILSDGYNKQIWYRVSKIETVDGSPMSSAYWLFFLKAPLMETMLWSLRKSDTERIIHTLFRVCRFQWFSEEFRAAGGLEWLIEKFPAAKKNQAATIICLSLDFAEKELDVVSWMQELYNLLVSYNNIGGFQEPEMFSDAVERVYSSQRQHRGILQPDSATADQSPINTVQDAVHAYVLNWSEVRWNQWCKMIEDISGGLRRGYIRVEPSESASCFVSDPDGLCSH